MFYYVQGTVAHIAPNLAVIDCGGVGYACKTTANTISTLNRGKVHKLYTHLYVKEEIFELYGFATESELNSFQMLLGVSGVGPKAALAILSYNSPESLAMAIVSGNEKALTAAPGIGKKIAQRVILELKDKLAKAEDEFAFSSVSGAAVPAVVSGDKAREAAAALSVLGYGPAEINAALKGVDMATLPLEEIIRQALKHMVK
jgi:Holliday junction DNA helicase RuvA